MVTKYTGKLSATAIFPESLKVLSENIIDIIKIGVLFYLIPTMLGVILSILLGINSISTSSLYASSNELEHILLNYSTWIILLWVPLCFCIAIIPIWGNLSIVKFINSKLKNEQVTWIDAIKYAFSKTGTTLLLVLLIFVATIIWFITMLLFITLISVFTLLIGLPIAIVAVIVFSVALLVYLQFIVQAIVDKNLGVFQAIGYSFKTVSGRFWNVFGKIALLRLVCILFSIGLAMFALIPFVGVIISSLISVCITIFQHIVITIIFNDYTNEYNYKLPNELDFKL